MARLLVVKVIYFFTRVFLVSLQPLVLVWQVRLANCLKKVSLETKTIFETENDSCSKLGNQLCPCLSLEVVNYLDWKSSGAWRCHVYETPILLTYMHVYMKKLLNLSHEIFTFLSYHQLTIGIQFGLHWCFCVLYQSKPLLLFLTQLDHWRLTLFEKKEISKFCP